MAGKYEVGVEGRVIVIRCIGAWDRPLREEFLGVLDETIDGLPPGKPWATLVDFTAFQLAADDTLDVARKAVALCEARGRAHGAFMIGSLDVGQAMIERQVIDRGKVNVRHFQNEKRAREWLAELGYFT